MQGSSWADALRGNHSIELKLEKQAAVSEAFRQDRQAVLSWGKNLFFSRRADGGLSRVGREGRRGKVDSTLIEEGSSSILGDTGGTQKGYTGGRAGSVTLPIVA